MTIKENDKNRSFASEEAEFVRIQLVIVLATLNMDNEFSTIFCKYSFALCTDIYVRS